MEEVKLIEKSIGAMLRENAETRSSHEYIVYSNLDIRHTYRQFDQKVDDLAKGLLEMGLTKGDHIGILANNVPDYPVVFFAAARAGMVLVTINPSYKLYELEYLIRQSDLKAICTVNGYGDSDYVEMLNQLMPELADSVPGQLRSEKFPCLKLVIKIGHSTNRGMVNIQSLYDTGANTNGDKLRQCEAQVTPNDVVCIMYTSGTTGSPKGVMLTHRNILNNGYYVGHSQHYTSKEVICLPAPLFHCMGITGGLMTALAYGASIAVLEKFDIVMVMATVQKEKCTVLYGVPTMYIAILNHPMFNMFDLSSLRTGIMAGSLCPEELVRKVVEKMHMSEITTTFGLTECSPAVTHSRWDDPIKLRAGTVGRPLPGVEVSIRTPETNQECPDETEGEICARGYNVMKGYYKMPDATAQCIDSEGWLHSGDLGIRRKDGYFQVMGRLKDMIIRGGENVYPKEIEEFLYTMPGIQDAQVVGVPSAYYGEEVCAFILLKDGVSMKEAEVTDYCRGKISRYKVPKYVFFVESFPLTANGKVQKFKLREMGEKLLKEQAAGA